MCSQINSCNEVPSAASSLLLRVAPVTPISHVTLQPGDGEPCFMSVSDTRFHLWGN